MNVEDIILNFLNEQTKFSGIFPYPVEIEYIQNELDISDIKLNIAISNLIKKNIVRYRFIGNTAIELVSK